MKWLYNWQQKRMDEKGYKFRQARREQGLDTTGISKVADRIWIGGLCDVLDTRQVIDNNINFVLNVCRKEAWTTALHIWLPLNDNHGNTYDQFESRVSMLDLQYKFGSNCLVSCVSGINRSVSVVCAFLAVKDKLSFEEALAQIKSVRPFANPTPENTALIKEYIEKHK